MSRLVYILNGPNLNLLGKREAFRHHSYVSTVASGVIAGFGTQGYQLAMQRMARLIDDRGK